MDFFSKFKKSKTFQEELEDFERKNSSGTQTIYEIAKKLQNLIKTKKIKNIQEIEDYLFNNQNYPLLDKIDRFNVENDKLLTVLFFYFWLGASKCIPQDNMECLDNLNHFFKVYSKYRDNFEPFVGVDYANRNKILRDRAISVGYYITLNDKLPGGFIILDNYGMSYYWKPTDKTPLLKFIEQIALPSTQKNTYSSIPPLFEEYFKSKKKPAPNKPLSKYTPPQVGEECINDETENTIKLLIEALQNPNKTEDELNELKKIYKRISVKIHPDKLLGKSDKIKERCVSLFKILTDILTDLR